MQDEIIKFYKECPNYSVVGRKVGLTNDRVRRRIMKLRAAGVTLPDPIRFPEESRRMIGETNKDRHGQDVYKRIGSVGGHNGTTGGFYANRELARRAGKIGGRVSRRGSRKGEQASVEAKHGNQI